MRFSSLILLSAFLATVTGQTLTYKFPPTGSYTSKDTVERYQICVKGAKWADLITTNLEDEKYRFDISSLDFKNGDKIDGRWSGRYAVNVPDSFACKGGILFQHDNLSEEVSLDLTLKATLDDGESKLTVCAFYAHYIQGDWQNILQTPERGFALSSNVFELANQADHNYGQDYSPEQQRFFSRAQTICRDFEPGGDNGFFSEAEPLPKPVTYTFPEVGPTGIMPGICIKGAQFASATNSVVDYPKYEMSTRQFSIGDNLWMDRYWWETNRNRADSSYPLRDNAFDWSPRRQGIWTAGNPCDGSLYLQPQRLEQTGYYLESPKWTNQYLRLLDADQERLAKNKITVEILPKKDEQFVQICAVIKMTDQTTEWLNLENYGFTTEGIGAGIGTFGIYCKDVAVGQTRVTMKLQL